MEVILAILTFIVADKFFYFFHLSFTLLPRITNVNRAWVSEGEEEGKNKIETRYRNYVKL